MCEIFVQACAIFAITFFVMKRFLRHSLIKYEIIRHGNLLYLKMNLENYDGLGLAKLIKQKQLSSKELFESVILKTEALQPKLNFLSHKFYDYGLKQIEAGLPQGPFSGVPFLLKNLGGACESTPLSEGSRLFKDTICSYDDEVVKRLKKSGLVFFGRSNAPELGFSFTTEPSHYGASHNPWNLNLTTGGSSGGAAAAVAARIIPVAHASDGGGSIRIPASCCGLFGLKPSRARVPMGPLIGEAWGGFATHHVLSLSVRDSAAMLDCIAGPELGDPYFAPAQPQSYLSSLDTPVRKLKIGVLHSLKASEKIEADVQAAFSHSQTLLRHLGHDLVDFTFTVDIDAMRKAFIIIATACLKSMLKQIEKQRGNKIPMGTLEPINEVFAEFAEDFSAADYASAVQNIQFHSRKVAELFSDYDVVMLPTTAQSARPLGELAGDYKDFGLYNAKQLAFGPNTGLANMTGQPAMSVPLFWNEEGTPIGTQFLAPLGDELTLFQLAKQLEEAEPWFNKVPKP